MADKWRKIRTAYITGTLSYRKLADKYSVPYGTLRARAKAEGWVEKRAQHQHKTDAKALERISDQQADELARINVLADGLLEKLEKAVGELDYKATEYTERQGDKNAFAQTTTIQYEPGGVVNQKALRELTAALKDLKEVKGIQSELARQEQEARIAELRRRAAADDDKTSGVIVELEGGAEDYAQ